MVEYHNTLDSSRPRLVFIGKCIAREGIMRLHTLNDGVLWHIAAHRILPLGVGGVREDSYLIVAQHRLEHRHHLGLLLARCILAISLLDEVQSIIEGNLDDDAVHEEDLTH